MTSNTNPDHFEARSKRRVDDLGQALNGEFDAVYRALNELSARIAQLEADRKSER